MFTFRMTFSLIIINKDLVVTYELVKIDLDCQFNYFFSTNILKFFLVNCVIHNDVIKPRVYLLSIFSQVLYNIWHIITGWSISSCYNHWCSFPHFKVNITKRNIWFRTIPIINSCTT